MKIERKWGCEAPIQIDWSEIDIDYRVRDSKKDAPELRRRVWSTRYRVNGAMMVQTTPFWRVAWSIFLCPLHRAFSSLLEGKVVFVVEQPPVDGDRSATALLAWGLGDRWLLTRKTKGQFWNSLPKQYIVHNNNNNFVINGPSPYSNLFGFDFRITFKWATANITSPF